MNILFVDDRPEFKVQYAIEYLKRKNLNFNYEILKSVNSALRYLANPSNKFDLAIVDLGLPQFDNGQGYGQLKGLIIVNEIFIRDMDIPIIINSTTEIPNEKEYLKQFTDDTPNAIVKHMEFLDLNWITEFVIKH